MRWHCPLDAGFEIRALAVWGRKHYLSVTEEPHSIENIRVCGEETFSFFETWKVRVGFESAIPDFPSRQVWPLHQGLAPNDYWCWKGFVVLCFAGMWWYANGVHLSAIWENTALVQWIRCEPLGEHRIHWTCAVFHISHEKWTTFVFSHTIKSHMTYPPYIAAQSTARVRYGLIPIYVS